MVVVGVLEEMMIWAGRGASSNWWGKKSWTEKTWGERGGWVGWFRGTETWESLRGGKWGFTQKSIEGGVRRKVRSSWGEQRTLRITESRLFLLFFFSCFPYFSIFPLYFVHSLYERPLCVGSCWFQVVALEVSGNGESEVVDDWSQNMCSNGTYSIWFVHQRTFKSPNLT